MVRFPPQFLATLLALQSLLYFHEVRAQEAAANPATWAMPPMSYFVKALPPPPRPGSFRDRMDYSDALARQKLVTQADQKSIDETYLFTVFYFSKVFGRDFTAEKYPKTAAFFSKLINTANGVVNELKNHYKRPRPFVSHPKIKLLVPNESGYSYPSGHTTRSRLCAFVIAEMDPAAKTPVAKAAELVATDRILAGEHYLTDLEGGRRLSKIIYAALKDDPEFLRELNALKESSEWTPGPQLVR